MKTSTYAPTHIGHLYALIQKPAFPKNLSAWIKTQEPIWEANRLGISATGIFIQVTFAAAMIALLGIAGAPVVVYTIGTFFAFIANSLSFAQAPVKIILVMFLVSILVNSSLALYYVIKMTGH